MESMSQEDRDMAMMVNQVGYEADAPGKKAVMSQPGGYVLKNMAGETVWQGQTGRLYRILCVVRPYIPWTLAVCGRRGNIIWKAAMGHTATVL